MNMFTHDKGIGKDICPPDRYSDIEYTVSVPAPSWPNPLIRDYSRVGVIEDGRVAWGRSDQARASQQPTVNGSLRPLFFVFDFLEGGHQQGLSLKLRVLISSDFFSFLHLVWVWRIAGATQQQSREAAWHQRSLLIEPLLAGRAYIRFL